jgi:hypothetical protein
VTTNSTDSLVRGMICFSLALGFEEDRARLGLSVALDRLRDALVENDLLLPDDDLLLARVLGGNISREEFAEALCSMKRMGFPGGATH